MTTAVLEGRWAFSPLSLVTNAVRRVLGERPSQPDVRPLEVPTRVRELAERVLTARNPPELRQVLGEVGMSAELASFQLDAAERFSQLEPRELEDARSLPPVVATTLGKTAAALLAETLEHLRIVALWQLRNPSVGTGAPTNERRDPDEIARLRHELVLGDLLPATTAQLLLTMFRGDVALLVLLAACARGERVAEWMSVSLAEVALEGARLTPRFVLPYDRIDLDAEVALHSAKKRAILDELLADES